MQRLYLWLRKSPGLWWVRAGSGASRFLPCTCSFCIGATSWLAAGCGSPIHTKPRLYISSHDLFLFEWAVLFLALPLSLLPQLFFPIRLGPKSYKSLMLCTVAGRIYYSNMGCVCLYWCFIMLWVLIFLFPPQMHCHFIMAINNLKDGETLLKKRARNPSIFLLVWSVSHYLCGTFVRLLMMLISAQLSSGHFSK